MTRKRFVKLMQAIGYPRRDAESIARHIAQHIKRCGYDSYSYTVSRIQSPYARYFFGMLYDPTVLLFRVVYPLDLNGSEMPREALPFSGDIKAMIELIRRRENIQWTEENLDD